MRSLQRNYSIGLPTMSCVIICRLLLLTWGFKKDIFHVFKLIIPKTPKLKYKRYYGTFYEKIEFLLKFWKFSQFGYPHNSEIPSSILFILDIILAFPALITEALAFNNHACNSLRANADQANAKVTSLFGLGCHSINLCSQSKRFRFHFHSNGSRSDSIICID